MWTLQSSPFLLCTLSRIHSAWRRRTAFWGLVESGVLGGKDQTWEPGRGCLLLSRQLVPDPALQPRLFPLPLLGQVRCPGLGSRAQVWHCPCLLVPYQGSAAFSQVLACQALGLAQTGPLSPDSLQPLHREKACPEPSTSEGQGQVIPWCCATSRGSPPSAACLGPEAAGWESPCAPQSAGLAAACPRPASAPQLPRPLPPREPVPGQVGRAGVHSPSHPPAQACLLGSIVPTGSVQCK